MDDVRLATALAAAAETERGIRAHLERVRGQAAEQARGQKAYRYAVGLRMALEDWIETRTFTAQQEIAHGEAR